MRGTVFLPYYKQVMDQISKILNRHKVDTLFLPTKQVQTKFYEALQAILSRFGTFTSEEFADDEKSKLAHSLKDFIDVIIELNGTESEKLDALLFSTMKFVVLEWKPMKLTAIIYLLIAFKEPGGSLLPSHKPAIGFYPVGRGTRTERDKFADTRGENETKERTDGDSSSEELVEDKISENKYIDEENEDILIVNIDEGEKREEECISDEIQMESAYEDEATEAISVEGRYLVEVPWPVTNPESRKKRTKCRKVNSTEAGDSLVTSTRTGSDRIEECGGPSTSSSSSSTSPDDDDDDDVKLDDSNYSESVGVKIYCIEGSYTWYKLRKQLKSLIKCVKDKTEALEVVRILQPVHSIVRCAMEAVVLLENNCRCPPAASPYLFVFFDGSIGDVVECLTKVLSTVSFTRIEDFEEVFVICVEIVGILLHLPDLPYVLHIKMFSPNKTSVEILQRSLEISKKNVHLQKALASVVGDISCVISGSCLYLRKMDVAQVTYKMVCVECHPDRKLYCASELDYMETFEARILKCLDLVNSEYSEVLVNIALLNHSLGGLQFGTSLQHVVRALGFSSCSDFLQKDSHHLLPFLVPAMLKLPGAVKLLDDIGKFMMIEPKVLIEESFQTSSSLTNLLIMFGGIMGSFETKRKTEFDLTQKLSMLKEDLCMFNIRK
ncbi:hypothetical protein ANN_20451 [Periplaneta americana]|uniref:Uncharacterized protein n=1 Tax=Periplaneta americana TaxID=6978 RepID=A0ABQ8SCV8_PERAM|nr:hypothetical protein ANN_20451 [Periplaneta americana]